MSTTVPHLMHIDNDFPSRWRTVSSDFEGELRRETQRALKKLLETSMEIEVQDLIGPRWHHNDSSTGYRNGYRYRDLMSGFGFIHKIKVPRVRSGTITFRAINRYARRTKDVDATVVEMFLAGVSTRRVKEVCAPILGRNALSAGVVSRVTKCLDEQVNRFHRRPLHDDYRYLIADAIYLNVKNPLLKKRRCVLAVYGISSAGIRELIAFQLAHRGESQSAWELMLNNLYHRGLKGANLILAVRDGSTGLKNALNTVFPLVPQQHCWAHKLRNVANKLPKTIADDCIAHARRIYCAKNRATATTAFKDWVRSWRSQAPAAVACLSSDFDYLLNFFAVPEQMRIKLRTTNIIERAFREVRRRTRPISCFQDAHSLQRIMFAVFFRLNKNWRENPLKSTHFS